MHEVRAIGVDGLCLLEFLFFDFCYQLVNAKYCSCQKRDLQIIFIVFFGFIFKFIIMEKLFIIHSPPTSFMMHFRFFSYFCLSLYNFPNYSMVYLLDTFLFYDFILFGLFYGFFVFALFGFYDGALGVWEVQENFSDFWFVLIFKDQIVKSIC